MQKIGFFITCFLLSCFVVSSAEKQSLTYPLILWSAEEAAEIRKTIETEAWAAAQYQRLFKDDVTPEARRTFDNLFRFLVMGDRSVIDFERAKLLAFIGCPPYVQDSFDWQWHRVDHYQMVLRYDALYGELTPAQRQGLEQTFRNHALHGIEHERIRGWNNHPRMPSHHLCALVTGDRRLIKGIFECNGGLKWVLDNLLDGYFSGFSEQNLGHAMLWCRGCDRLGLSDLGKYYRSEKGGSLQRALESLFIVADPAITIPGGSPFYGSSALREQARTIGSFPVETVGSLPLPFYAPLVVGRTPDGTGENKRWSAEASGPLSGLNVTFDTGEARMMLPLIFELASLNWPESGFSYFLYQMRDRNKDYYEPSLYWGLKPIYADRFNVPAINSQIYPDLGLACLRAEKGAGYWQSPAPSLGLWLGHAHGRAPECLSLGNLYAFNRPIILSQPLGVNQRHNPGFVWGVCGIEVDGLRYGQRQGQHGIESYIQWPSPMVDLPKNYVFSEQVKFIAAWADAKEKDGVKVGLYPGVSISRALVLTENYCLDLSLAQAEEERQYRWISHPLGQRMNAAEPGWKDSSTLSAMYPHEYEKSFRFKDERMLVTNGQDWMLDVRQQCQVKSPAESRLGSGWYAQEVGLLTRMLGIENLKVYTAEIVPVREIKEKEDNTDTPRPRDRNYDAQDKGFTEIVPLATVEQNEREAAAAKLARPRYTDLPSELGRTLIVAESKSKNVEFIVLYEPYEKRQTTIESWRVVRRNGLKWTIEIVGNAPKKWRDLIFISAEQHSSEVIYDNNGERFVFDRFGWLRITEGAISISGNCKSILIRASAACAFSIDDREVKAQHVDGLLSWKQQP